MLSQRSVTPYLLAEAEAIRPAAPQNEFTSLLLPPLVSRLRHHLPQLLSMPPVLAHTVYQVVEFDQQLRSRGYKPRTWPTVLRPDEQVQEEEEGGEWEGLSETILGRQEWFDKWIDGERECESIP